MCCINIERLLFNQCSPFQETHYIFKLFFFTKIINRKVQLLIHDSHMHICTNQTISVSSDNCYIKCEPQLPYCFTYTPCISMKSRLGDLAANHQGYKGYSHIMLNTCIDDCTRTHVFLWQYLKKKVNTITGILENVEYRSRVRMYAC